MVKQFLILFLILFLGYGVTYFTGMPIPANVAGLLILFSCLCAGIIKLRHVDKVSDFMIKYLAVFFIVPTVGVVVYLDLIGSQAVQILVPLFISVLLGFFVAGKSTEITINIMKKMKKKKVIETEQD